MPTISVIVPVYKVELYLRRCIDSILGQTFTDFELILVDDGSPDNCPAICDEYAAKDSRVHVIHQENGGLSAARNAGIDWASANSDSEWISFVDSDDWVHSQYLEILFQAVEQYKVKISMCPLMRVTETVPDASVEEFQIELLQPDVAYTYKNKGIAAYACGRLYAKECFSSIRYPVGKLWEDVFTTHKLIFSCDIVARIEIPLYYYYKNETGICAQPWSHRNLDEIQAYLQLTQFFHSNHIDSMQDIACGTCLEVIGRQFDEIRYSNFSTRQKRYYLAKVRKYARTVIICYKKGRISNLWCYEIAFPHLMRCYWIFKSKVDRFFSK